MKKNWWIIVALIAAATLIYVLATKSKLGGQAQLTGNVSYLERIALPSGSRVEVQIREAEEVIAETSITTQGENVPIPFTINYEAKKIKSDGNYSIFAHILTNVGLRWETDANVPLLENGKPKTNVELVLKAGSTPIDAAALQGRKFKMSSYNGAAVPAASNYTLSFGSNTLNAEICNAISGSFTLSNNIIKGDLASTLKFCSTPDGVMSVEDAFKTILNTGATLSFSGDALIFTGNGQRIVFFPEE